MKSSFRAVALGYDGTLADGARPADAVLATLREIRSGGCRLILVTSRILAELRGEFPDCHEHFDLIVAENGALVARDLLTMPLATPVPRDLDRALRDAGIVARRGHLIMASREEHEKTIRVAMKRGAPDCQIIHNRGELLIVPAGVTKATGLQHALLQIGVSPHSTIAVGDAETDLAMFDVCEVAIAVGDALAAVKARADVVLTEPNGAGVVDILRRALLDGSAALPQRRWWVTLGTGPGGDPVRVPASGDDMIIAGGTGSGKSFAAGLIAEQLVQLGYVVCVFDPEGDHVPLGRLPNMVSLGGRDRAPAAQDLAQIFEQSGTSVVIDLTLLAPQDRHAWTLETIRFLEVRRAKTGVPHWLIIDEAQAHLGDDTVAQCIDRNQKGHCLITYQPAELAAYVTAGTDYALLVGGNGGIDPACARAVAAATGLPDDAFGQNDLRIRRGEALLVRKGARPAVERLRFGPRWVSHVRHWHKYTNLRLPAARRFYFRSPGGLTGAVAASMEEFHRELARASLDTIRQHARGGDFSRWIAEVFLDPVLAAAIRRGERRARTAVSEQDGELAREELRKAIEGRYPAPVAPGA